MFDSCICIEPDEVGVLISSNRLRARVVHVCCECHGAIIPGDLYERDALKFDVDISTYKTCLTCSRIRKSLFRCGFYYGAMWADIHKAYCDTDYCICPDEPEEEPSDE